LGGGRRENISHRRRGIGLRNGSSIDCLQWGRRRWRSRHDTPSASASTTASSTAGVTHNTPEYQASNPAVLASALAAYDAGATGAGVKVAVVDTGINPNLPEFIGRVDPASQDVAANRGIVDHQGHGSMVSGVIAANKDGQYMQGVAYNATILSLNVYDPAGCKAGNDCLLDDKIDEAIDLAVASGRKSSTCPSVPRKA
jgi:subtilisin family serine protease